MRTKQEIVSFLESKVGGGVECKGNPSLNSQCVTLIKSLMEYLGVPDPYKARGHAKTAISAYLSEGIAKPGLGFISVFSNKDMGGGYGHIWCNAGEGTGTFYESNGVKPLTVTKGKTYSYDSVCNFDQWILNDDIEQIKKDLAEQRQQVKNYSEQVTGLLKDIESLKGVISDAETKLGTANGRIQELIKQNENISSDLGAKTSALLVAEQSAKTAKEALQKELGDQLDYGDKWEDEQNKHNDTKKVLFDLLWEIEDGLKLSHPTDDTTTRISVALGALQSLIQTNISYQNQVIGLEKEVKRLTTHKKPIDKLSIKECIIIIIEKIKELYGKK